MKKIFFVLVMLGMFTGVSLVQAAPVVTTNAASDRTASDQAVKKEKKHKKSKAHHKAKKEAKEDKKEDKKETTNATK
jgi:hypothetical protein